MKPVTDPSLLAQLNDNSGKPVTDPELLAQLNGDGQSQASPSFLDTVGNAVSKIGRTMPVVAGAMSPGYGLAVDYLTRQAPANSEKLGNAVAEGTGQLAGRYISNPEIRKSVQAGGVVLGAGLQAASNPLTYAPTPSLEGTVAKWEPTIPPERAPLVASAEKMGISPTLADKTGSRGLAGIENKLSRTPLGQGPLSDVYSANAKALEANKQELLSKYGTETDPSVVGQNVVDAITSNKKPLRELKNQAFENVYGNVNVPLPEAEGTALKFIQEQDKAPAGYGNPELRSKAGGILDIKNKVSTGEGVNEGKGYYGTPDNTVGYQASPPEAPNPKPNYEQIKIVREGLNGLIQKETMPSGEVTPTGQKYIALKSSLDKDISNFAKQNSGNPLSDFEAQQFSDTYNQANKLSSDYATKFKNPAVNDALALARNGRPEKIVDVLFTPKNNVTTINRIKSAAGPEAFGLAKKAWITDLLQKGNVAQTLLKYEPETLRAILNPQELNDLMTHGQVGSLNMTAERPGMGANKSESGTFNVHAAQYGAALGGIGASLSTGNPLPAIAGVGQFVAPRYLSKAYVAAGNGIPLNASLSNVTSNISKGVAMNPQQRQSLIEEYVRRHGGPQ